MHIALSVLDAFRRGIHRVQKFMCQKFRSESVKLGLLHITFDPQNLQRLWSPLLVQHDSFRSLRQRHSPGFSCEKHGYHEQLATCLSL